MSQREPVTFSVGIHRQSRDRNGGDFGPGEHFCSSTIFLLKDLRHPDSDAGEQKIAQTPTTFMITL